MGAIKNCTTFQDFKDLVCIRKQWIDFKDMSDTYENLVNGFRVIEDFINQAAEMYAKYKAKEAVKEYKKSIKV